MPETVSRRYLYLLVFTAGFTTLGVELTAARLLDPWFGNSLIVWASLIGLIMLYLAPATGWAAASPTARRTCSRCCGWRASARWASGLVPAVAAPVLQIASQGMADFDAGLLAGSMAAMLILFSVPVTLLGCVSPFAIRLAIRDCARQRRGGRAASPRSPPRAASSAASCPCCC